MDTKRLLKEYKKVNPELANLSPIVEIKEILERGRSDDSQIVTYDPPLIEIEVKHPFIFDNRLIPAEFKGCKVNNIQIGKLPKEFDVSRDENVLLTDFYHPDKYVKFVNRKLPLIAKRINKPNLTKEEALDALTGDFEKHLNWFNAKNK